MSAAPGLALLLSLAASALLWGCAALGSLAFARLEVPEPVRRLAGLGVVSLAGFLCCAIGFPPAGASGSEPVLAALFVVAGLSGWGVVVRRRAELACFATTSPLARVSAAVLVSLMAAALLWAQLPPTRVDEGAYHLALPAHALELGHFDLIWGHIYTGFPGLAEMLFLWPLSLGAESGARSVQVIVVALAVWSTIELSPKAFAAQIVQGWVLLLLIPVAFVELPCAYVDLIQLSYELIAILCVHQFIASPDSRRSASCLLAAGWLIGCAAATKYLAFPSVVLLAAMAGWGVFQLRRVRQTLPGTGWLLGAVGAVLVPIVPWLAKNVFERGNPIFPFGLTWFPSAEFGQLQQRIYEHQLRAVGPLDGAGAPRMGWDALVHLPAAVLFGGHFSSLELDGVIGPVVLVGLLVTFLPRRRDGAVWANPGWLLSIYGVFKLVLWLATSWQARFLLPALVPVCAAIPFRLENLRSRRSWAIGIAALAACLLFQVRAIATALPKLDWRAFGSAETRHALRLEVLPDTFLCDLAKSIQPMKLMLVWSQRLSYWCPANQTSDSIIESLTLDDWLAAGGEAAALRGLESRSITHLLIDEDRLLKLPPVRMPPAEQARYDRVAAGYQSLKARDLVLVGRGATRLLYAVRPQ